MITTSVLTFWTSAETLLLWACCPVGILGKMPLVGLHCSCVLGKRCKVVKTTSWLCLFLNGSLLRSLISAVLQPPFTSLQSDLIDKWPFFLLSVPFPDPLAKAESCKAPSPSSLFGLSSCTSSFFPPSLSCSSETSGLSRPWRSLWWTCPESCQEETHCLYRILLLWQSNTSENNSDHCGLRSMQNSGEMVLGSNTLHYCGAMVKWWLFSVIVYGTGGI